MRHPRWTRFLLATALLASLLVAGPSFSAEPGEGHAGAAALGFSPPALDRLDTRLQEYVDAGHLVGGVLLVQRFGHPAYFHAFGQRDKESAAPMQRDAIFRIASQSKAIVSVAAMMLQEEGKLLISHPVSRYLPEYEKTTVAVVTDESGGPNGTPLYEVVPAQREITIRDLLTHTSGVSYGNGPAAAAWSAAGITGWYFADRDEPIRETVRRIASLPFNSQPGEQFVYGYSTDILGAVVEVASGQPLDEFLRQRIFEPLKMTDTHFYLPPEKRDRLATVYSLSSEGMSRAPDEGTMVSQGHYVVGPRKSFSGGAGLLSTARDYGRFQQMLLSGGQLDGARILSPASVRLMTVNHVGEAFGWTTGSGFGLGFSIALDLGARGVLGNVGEYAWGGAYHSSYWNDPEEQLTVTYMTQLLPAGPLDDHQMIRTLIYAALLSDNSGAAAP
jgi:CubicO group peptidase (beta-lactamase class C family)